MADQQNQSGDKAAERMQQLEEKIAKLEAALSAKVTFAPPAPKSEGEMEDPLSNPMVKAAMEAYGIKPEDIAETDGKLAVRVARGRVVIITKAGFKAKFEKGDKVKKLKRVQLDPVPPPSERPESDED